MLGQCRVTAITEPRYYHMLQSQGLAPQSQPALLGKRREQEARGFYQHPADMWKRVKFVAVNLPETK